MSGAIDAMYALGGLVEAVRGILDDHDGTLAVVLVEVPAPAPPSVLSAQLAALRDGLGASVPAGAELHVVDEGPGSDALLARLNSSRDVYARFCPLILLLVEDGPGTQSVFRRAPDLLSGLTQLLRLKRRAERIDKETLRERLGQHHRATWGTLRLSGLVPHNPTLTGFNLNDVYVGRIALPAPASERPLVLLVGEPGSGKSVLLRATALGLAAAGDLGGRVPFLLPLSAWSAENSRRATSLAEWVLAEAARAVGHDAVVSEDLFPHLWLLLDGLDEVALLVNRRRVLDEAEDLVRQWPGLCIVVSGRELVLEQLLAKHRERWRALRIDVWNRTDAETLVRSTVRAWHQVAPGAPLAADVGERVGRALTSETFSSLHGSPLLVVFYTVLMELDREPPSHVPALYNSLVEMLIVNWQAVRAGSGPRLSRAEAYRTLGPLGWGLIEAGVVGLTRAELLQRLEAADTLSAPGAERTQAAERRLQQLSEDSALLMVEGGRWRFHHLTIAEFLAARSALQDRAVAQALAAEPYLPQRQQTVAFAVSLVLDIEPRDDLARQWLDALGARARRAGVYDAKIPSTLAAVLAHARGLPPGDRAALSGHLRRIAFDQKLTPWQRDIAVGAWARADLVGAVPDELRTALVENIAARESVGQALMKSLDDGAAPQLARWLVSDPRVGHSWLASWLSDASPAVRVRSWVVGVWCQDFSEVRVAAVDPAAARLLPKTVGGVPLSLVRALYGPIANALPAPLQHALDAREAPGPPAATQPPQGVAPAAGPPSGAGSRT